MFRAEIVRPDCILVGAGPCQHSFIEVSGTHVGSPEVCVAQICSAKVRVLQICVSERRPLHFRILQVRSPEISVLEIALVQPHPSQPGKCKIGVTEEGAT
jgi:hypothetical protein